MIYSINDWLNNQAWNEEGQSVEGESGDLVCTVPFPSMPVRYVFSFCTHLYLTFPVKMPAWYDGSMPYVLCAIPVNACQERLLNLCTSS